MSAGRGGNRLGRRGSGAGERAARNAQPPTHCIVSWTGKWQCYCGKRYGVMESCQECGIAAPCRDYLRNACARPPQQCPFSHPPFRLGPPPASVGTRACLVAPEAAGLSPRQVQRVRSGAQQAREPGQHCIVSWTGNWQCGCGRRYSVADDCRDCAIPPPCRDYLRNACTRPPQQCPFSHPPLRLGPPPRSVGTHACLVVPEAVGLSLQQAELGPVGAAQQAETRGPDGSNAPKVLDMPTSVTHSRAAGTATAARQQQGLGAQQPLGAAALLAQQQEQLQRHHHPLLAAVAGPVAAGEGAAAVEVLAAPAATALPQMPGTDGSMPLPLHLPLANGGTQLPLPSDAVAVAAANAALLAASANAVPGEGPSQAELIQLLAMLGVKS